MKKSRILLFWGVMGLILGGCGSNETPVQTESVQTEAIQTEAISSAETEVQTENAETEAVSAKADTAVQGETKTEQNTENNASGITEEEALAAALAHAGVEEKELTGQRVKKDWDDGREVYEVEFYVNEKEYDYELSAADGEILSADFEIEDDFRGNTGMNSGEEISEEEAKRIALERVPGAEQVRIKKDRDDGRTVYEGEIFYENVEYEFEIDAVTGEILSWDEEF